ncbi:MAG TPA: hypothetical protein VJ862_11685 [Rhodanobacteraceae bacterium]|nr:hypothetical protein [Rhodanobacteraceae bacterium]
MIQPIIVVYSLCASDKAAVVENQAREGDFGLHRAWNMSLAVRLNREAIMDDRTMI